MKHSNSYQFLLLLLLIQPALAINPNCPVVMNKLGGESNRKTSFTIQENTRPTPETLHTALTTWEKIPASQLGESTGDVVFKIKDDYVAAGKIEPLPTSDPNYRLYLLTDTEGYMRLIDSKQPMEMSVAPKEFTGFKIPEKKNSGLEAFVDKTELKKRGCGIYSQIDNEKTPPEVKRFVNKHVKRAKLADLAAAYHKMCGIGHMGVAGTFFFGDIFRALGGRDLYFAQHGSNFAFGLSMLTAMHACFSSTAPEKRHLFLATFLAANTAANAMLEMKEINGKETDWEDIKMGMLSTATYATFAMGLEIALNMKFSDACK